MSEHEEERERGRGRERTWRKGSQTPTPIPTRVGAMGRGALFDNLKFLIMLQIAYSALCVPPQWVKLL